MDADIKKAPVKWYLKPVFVVIAIFVAGPFALPLVWKSPAFKRWIKITITILLILFTIWLIKVSVEIYQLFLKEMQELQSVLSQ